jgi:hypothetical protein
MKGKTWREGRGLEEDAVESKSHFLPTLKFRAMDCAAAFRLMPEKNNWRKEWKILWMLWIKFCDL